MVLEKQENEAVPVVGEEEGVRIQEGGGQEEDDDEEEGEPEKVYGYERQAEVYEPPVVDGGGGEGLSLGYRHQQYQGGFNQAEQPWQYEGYQQQSQRQMPS
jgi:hypothetical protein